LFQTERRQIIILVLLASSDAEKHL